MTLNATTFFDGGTTISSSDMRSKYNEEPLNCALDVIIQIEPVEYNQTHDLTENTQKTRRSPTNAVS